MGYLQDNATFTFEDFSALEPKRDKDGKFTAKQYTRCTVFVSRCVCLTKEVPTHQMASKACAELLKGMYEDAQDLIEKAEKRVAESDQLIKKLSDEVAQLKNANFH